MTGYRVGVVIPSWNSAKTLRTALTSLREQDDCVTEIIVADSGSTDGTLQICESLGIRTVYVAPGNMYAAINQGVRVLDADWVAYLNSDDFVYPDGYKRLIGRGLMLNADVVYGCSDYVDAQGRFLYSLVTPVPKELPALFNAMFFGFMPHAAIFRKRVFSELGGFDESFRHIADMEFFARASVRGKHFAAVPPPAVAAFRIHAGQISSRESAIVKEEKSKLRGRWGHGISVAGLWAITKWKLTNLRQYLVRWARTGALRQSQASASFTHSEHAR